MTRVAMFFRVMLVVLLALTAQQFALARGQTRIAGEAVLCLGGVAVTVQIDENGHPVEKAHFCPECAPALFARFDLPPVAPLDFVATGVAIAPPASLLAAGETATATRARGPPVLI